MRIKLTTVGEVTKEKSYYYIPISYEDKGKSFDKKIMSFTDVYGVFKTAKAGDSYEVSIEKDKNGYWQWVSASVAGDAPASTTQTATGRSNYETPDERAARQTSIQRQSSLAQAVAFLTGAVKSEDLTVQQVLDVASEFEAWVSREVA